MAPPNISSLFPEPDLGIFGPAIKEAQARSESENPLLQIAPAVMGVTQDPLDTTAHQYKQKALQGVVAGLLAGLGDQWQGSRNDDIRNAALPAHGDPGTGDTSSLASNVLAPIQNAKTIWGANQDAITKRMQLLLPAEQEMQDRQNHFELLKELALKDPSLAGATKKAEVEGEIQGKMASAGGSGGMIPIDPSKLADTALGISEKIANSEPGKNYNEAKLNFDSLHDLARQDSQSASIGMIKAAAKIMNPGSVVRESTFQILTDNPNNYSLQLQDYLNEVKGSGQLSPEHKQQLLQAVKPFVVSNYGAYKGYSGTLLNTLKNIGGDNAAKAVDVLPPPTEIRTDPNTGKQYRVILGE